VRLDGGVWVWVWVWEGRGRSDDVEDGVGDDVHWGMIR
jgi:hypothetical protein